MRDRTRVGDSRHQFEVPYVQRHVIQTAIVDDEDVTCGCGCGCGEDEKDLAFAPVLEEVVLPPSRPATVGLLSIDRDGLVALARRRGMAHVVLTARGS